MVKPTNLRNLGNFHSRLDKSDLGKLLLENPPFTDLTDREKDVFLDTLIGCSAEAISLRLRISPDSAKIYRKRVYDRLGVAGKDELYQLVIGFLVTAVGPVAGGLPLPFVAE
jgi:DNA-binding CsgD family transcriptional regulator